jgi:hypothetical protein
MSVSTLWVLVSMFRALRRKNADSGMKRKTRMSMRTKAPPMACIAILYDPNWITDPATLISSAMMYGMKRSYQSD